jgi:hypothetical protein
MLLLPTVVVTRLLLKSAAGLLLLLLLQMLQQNGASSKLPTLEVVPLCCLHTPASQFHKQQADILHKQPNGS